MTHKFGDLPGQLHALRFEWKVADSIPGPLCNFVITKLAQVWLQLPFIYLVLRKLQLHTNIAIHALWIASRCIKRSQSRTNLYRVKQGSDVCNRIEDPLFHVGLAG